MNADATTKSVASDSSHLKVKNFISSRASKAQGKEQADRLIARELGFSWPWAAIRAFLAMICWDK
ncbi:MAG: hypothetical protein WBN94_10450 [Methanothrix sp.]